MVFATFIYKLGNKHSSQSYYGKYVGNISDDHEGLDLEMKRYVKDGVNKYRKQNNLKPIKNIQLGILSLSYDGFVPAYSSEEEYKSFDFYMIEEDYYNKKLYINGKKINT